MIILQIDEEKRILEVNPQISLLGYESDEIAGKPLEALTSAGDLSILKAVAEVQEGETDARWEGKLLHRSGLPHDMIGSLTSIRHPSGMRLVVASLVDVTPLRETQRRLDALHRNAVEIGRVNKEESVYDICMDAVRNALGWENRSIAVLDGEKIVYVRDERQGPKTLMTYSSSGRSITARTFRTGLTQRVNDVSKDLDYAGHPPNVTEMKSFLMAPIRVRGAVKASINIGSTRTDVFSESDASLVEILAEHAASALERIEREREEERNRAARTEEILEGVERVIQMARHDLKGPFQAIMVSTYLLRNNKGENTESIETIENSVKFAREIVEDLRKKAIAADLDLSITDVSDLVERALSDLRKPPDVRVEASLEPRFVSADAPKMRRVFYNILKNALEAMPGGGIIRISTSSHSDSVDVSFEDTGVGIPEAAIPRLFSYGYTSKKEGSGLGLFFCKEIVEAHGGSISISSVEGKGTTVTVSLPVKPHRAHLGAGSTG